MLRRRLIAILGLGLATCWSGSALARATVPAMDHVNLVWRSPSGRPWSLEGVKQVILRAAQAARWQGDLPEPGKLLASYYVRNKHMIRVAITWTESTFSVRYDGSQNMNHWVSGDGRNLIHPNYMCGPSSL